MHCNKKKRRENQRTEVIKLKRCWELWQINNEAAAHMIVFSAESEKKKKPLSWGRPAEVCSWVFFFLSFKFLSCHLYLKLTLVHSIKLLPSLPYLHPISPSACENAFLRAYKVNQAADAAARSVGPFGLPLCINARCLCRGISVG